MPGQRSKDKFLNVFAGRLRYDLDTQWGRLCWGIFKGRGQIYLEVSDEETKTRNEAWSLLFIGFRRERKQEKYRL
jgi:hypothetical protein